ncbi:MAG: hypothetical protein NPMRTH4_2220003 [Nitrosopumilales archaeon]|nr:MAG: hypothetical protein NPMRTH4_2220003 [Nitrosopumilales archaeon]KAG2479011.1 MAG: hypothetical protein NPMRd3_810001 [Nitrosopumilales archaeon]
MLSEREKSIILIANAISVYSLYQERGELPKNTSMIDFILKTVPDDLKKIVSIELIDETFEFVSTTHSS